MGSCIMTFIISSSLVFFSFFSFALCGITQFSTDLDKDGHAPFSLANTTTCPTCVLVKSSSNIQTSFPWLFNNPDTKFFYSKTDSSGYPIYEYIFTNTFIYYLHFYDEGLFYDGFYVINDLETGYEEVDGRVFIYNSDSDDCPDDAGRNWYYWSGTKWVWDDSINLTI